MNRVRQHREQAGLTQQQLADAIGAGRVTINRIEQDTQTPDVGRAIKLAAVLGVTVGVLFGDEREPAPQRPEPKRKRIVPGPGHSPLGMSPDATPEHQLRENVVFLVDRAREMQHQIEMGTELRALDESDHRSLVEGLALVEQVTTQLNGPFISGRGQHGGQHDPETPATSIPRKVGVSGKKPETRKLPKPPGSNS